MREAASDPAVSGAAATRRAGLRRLGERLDPDQAARVAVTSPELSGIAWHDPAAPPPLQPEALQALERLDSLR